MAQSSRHETLNKATNLRWSWSWLRRKWIQD